MTGIELQTQATESSLSPRDLYDRRLSQAREDVASFDKYDDQLANGRLGVFLLAAIVGGLAFGMKMLSGWWITIPIVIFLGLVWLHGRSTRARNRAVRVVAIYERGLARVEDRWMGIGRDGSRFLVQDHPYAADLDLFGKGSLFQRISTACSVAGEETLASWLLTPADVETIRDRQEAVDELRPNVQLREDLMGLAEGLDQAIDVNALASWCEETERIPLNPLRVAAIVLAVIGSFVVLGYLAFDLDLRIVGLWLAIEAVFAAVLAKPCARILRGISKRADDLAKFAAILERIEREPFHSQRLQALQAMLIAEKQSASSRIRSLWKYSDLLEWQKNMVFAPFALVWIWGVQVAFAVEAWRRRSGREVFGWVKALGEIEALASLAAFAFEEAGSVFPQVEDSREPFIEGDELGHPLLPRPRCVRNSVNLGNPLRVLVVSGSNMSGKSTLMRSVGANVVLALAGGSVRASRMKLCPMAIGATLRIQDSLQEGKSRFYAEIVRLRLVVDLARGPLPLLFLLDEILAGTNSHDRLAGSSAVVRGLIDLGAIGIVTTHDLALAEVAERLAPRAENVHFEDDFVDGQMRFDYRMKPGVVKNSNALALMRAVGLDV